MMSSLYFLLSVFFLMIRRPPISTLFPTRRSSDLLRQLNGVPADGLPGVAQGMAKALVIQDRKSTRLNSSHVKISYAVFCLKKKKKRTMLRFLSSRHQKADCNALASNTPWPHVAHA